MWCLANSTSIGKGFTACYFVSTALLLQQISHQLLRIITQMAFLCRDDLRRRLAACFMSTQTRGDGFRWQARIQMWRTEERRTECRRTDALCRREDDVDGSSR